MTASPFKLYGYWRSSATWRVRIALQLKEIPYQYIPVNLVKDGGEQYKPEHQARNPMSQVPVLEWQQGSETRRLSQSMAIIEYLDETGPGPRLLPEDPLLRAQARMLAEHVNSGIQPLHNAIVQKRIRELVPADKSDARWAAEWISRGLLGLEGAVKPLAGRCCLGDSISLPDLFLAPQMYNARRFQVDLSLVPTLSRIEAFLAAQPAFLAAHADRQSDAPTKE